MFLGEFAHSLDNKGRLTIPAKFRDQLEAGLVLTRNPSEHCLLVFPLVEWQKLADKISALPITDQRSAQLRRAFFSTAEDTLPDKQGRILISQRLRDYAQIQEEVIVAGVNTFVELWHPPTWNERVLSEIENGALNSELFSALNI